jgi:transcriptional regulator with XRE-family HTH domain
MEAHDVRRRLPQDPTLLTIAARIRIAREQAGLSCAELARQVGVRPSAAVQWEAEHGTTPSVENLSRVATITRIAFEWLATGRGSKAMQSDGESQAVALSDFAQSPYEERWLRVGRKVPPRLRESLLRFLEDAYR